MNNLIHGTSSSGTAVNLGWISKMSMYFMARESEDERWGNTCSNSGTGALRQKNLQIYSFSIHVLTSNRPALVSGDNEFNIGRTHPLGAIVSSASASLAPALWYTFTPTSRTWWLWWLCVNQLHITSYISWHGGFFLEFCPITDIWTKLNIWQGM